MCDDPVRGSLCVAAAIARVSTNEPMNSTQYPLVTPVECVVLTGRASLQLHYDLVCLILVML